MVLPIREETFEFQEITAQREMSGKVRDNELEDMFISQGILGVSTKEKALGEGPKHIQ